MDAADELRFGVAQNELEMILENAGKLLLILTIFYRCVKELGADSILC